MAYEEETVRLTADNIRALSHPLRVQILGLLRTYGPATASGLAARLGLSSGALSYHLRQLERYGFIVDDDSRGDGRDRWWRAAHRSTTFNSTDLDPSVAEVGEAYERGVIAALSASLTRAYDGRSGLSPEWQDTFDMSDVLLQTTPEEALQLSRELLAVMRKYRPYTPGEPLAPGVAVFNSSLVTRHRLF